MAKMAKWINPDREAKLLELAVKTSNKCLLGHPLCSIHSHYIYHGNKPVKTTILKIDKKTGKPKMLKLVDKNGFPIKDRSGNQVEIEQYSIIADSIPFTKSYSLNVNDFMPVDNLSNLFDFYIDNPNALYEYESDRIIKDWVIEDRIALFQDWRNEYEIRHKINTQRLKPLRGRFSSVSRDVWHDSQPQFYIENFGFSAVNFKPFALVRIASSNNRLFVDITDCLKKLSHNKKRKLIRYSKTSIDLADRIYQRCSLAVSDFLG